MINLLPYKEKNIIKKLRSIRMLQLCFLGLSMLSMFFIILLLPTWISIKSRLSLLKSEIKKLENEGVLSKEVDISSLENRAEFAQSKLDALVQIQPGYYINSIKSLAPQSIILDKLSYQKEKQLDLSGTAQTREELQNFIQKLEKENFIDKIDNPVSNFIKNKNGIFNLTIYFK